MVAALGIIVVKQLPRLLVLEEAMSIQLEVQRNNRAGSLPKENVNMAIGVSILMMLML